MTRWSDIEHCLIGNAIDERDELDEINKIDETKKADKAGEVE